MEVTLTAAELAALESGKPVEIEIDPPASQPPPVTSHAQQFWYPAAALIIQGGH